MSGAAMAADAVRNWQAVRASHEIQFAPVKLPKAAPPPHGLFYDILRTIGDFLARIFAAAGEAIGISWPVFKWILAAIAVLLVLLVLWRLLKPVLALRLPKGAEEDENWAPDREAALSLLEEADRLAAEGRFGEAAHLLLKRSVEQIAAARPHWLGPASTAREISELPTLPERARGAFAAIAERVERSLFALRQIDRTDWQAARDAYADFAVADLAGADA